MTDDTFFTDDNQGQDDLAQLFNEEAPQPTSANTDPRADEEHPQHGDYLIEQSWKDYEVEARASFEAQLAEERRAARVGAEEQRRAAAQERRQSELATAGLAGDQNPAAQAAATDALFRRAEAGEISDDALWKQLQDMGAAVPPPGPIVGGPDVLAREVPKRKSGK